MKRKPARVNFVGLFLLLCAVPVYLVYAAHRQVRLDAALLQAVRKQDAAQVKRLLN